MRTFCMDQISTHNTRESLWTVIDDKVYDLTNFLNEHPGGESVLLESAGRDASSSFHDVGHSDDAKEVAKQYLIGSVEDPYEIVRSCSTPSKTKAVTWSDIIISPTWSNFLIPVFISVFVYSLYTLIKLLVENSCS